MREQFVKTKLCPYFDRGHCLNGEQCSYAHSEKELRPLPDLLNTKLCESVTKNYPCRNPDCSYAHTRDDLRATSDLVAYKTSLCFFHRKGKCLNGNKCRFAHGMDELKNNAGEQTPRTARQVVSQPNTPRVCRSASRPAVAHIDLNGLGASAHTPRRANDGRPATARDRVSRPSASTANRRTPTLPPHVDRTRRPLSPRNVPLSKNRQVVQGSPGGHSLKSLSQRPQTGVFPMASDSFEYSSNEHLRNQNTRPTQPCPEDDIALNDDRSHANLDPPPLRPREVGISAAPPARHTAASRYGGNSHPPLGAGDNISTPRLQKVPNQTPVANLHRSNRGGIREQTEPVSYHVSTPGRHEVVLKRPGGSMMNESSAFDIRDPHAGIYYAAEEGLEADDPWNEDVGSDEDKESIMSSDDGYSSGAGDELSETQPSMHAPLAKPPTAVPVPHLNIFTLHPERFSHPNSVPTRHSTPKYQPHYRDLQHGTAALVQPTGTPRGRPAETLPVTGPSSVGVEPNVRTAAPANGAVAAPPGWVVPAYPSYGPSASVVPVAYEASGGFVATDPRTPRLLYSYGNPVSTGPPAAFVGEIADRDSFPPVLYTKRQRCRTGAEQFPREVVYEELQAPRQGHAPLKGEKHAVPNGFSRAAPTEGHRETDANFSETDTRGPQIPTEDVESAVPVEMRHFGAQLVDDSADDVGVEETTEEEMEKESRGQRSPSRAEVISTEAAPGLPKSHTSPTPFVYINPSTGVSPSYIVPHQPHAPRDVGWGPVQGVAYQHPPSGYNPDGSPVYAGPPPMWMHNPGAGHSESMPAVPMQAGPGGWYPAPFMFTPHPTMASGGARIPQHIPTQAPSFGAAMASSHLGSSEVNLDRTYTVETSYSIDSMDSPSGTDSMPTSGHSHTAPHIVWPNYPVPRAGVVPYPYHPMPFIAPHISVDDYRLRGGTEPPTQSTRLTGKGYPNPAKVTTAGSSRQLAPRVSNSDKEPHTTPNRREAVTEGGFNSSSGNCPKTPAFGELDRNAAELKAHRLLMEKDAGNLLPAATRLAGGMGHKGESESTAGGPILGSPLGRHEGACHDRRSDLVAGGDMKRAIRSPNARGAIKASPVIGWESSWPQKLSPGVQIAPEEPDDALVYPPHRSAGNVELLQSAPTEYVAENGSVSPAAAQKMQTAGRYGNASSRPQSTRQSPSLGTSSDGVLGQSWVFNGESASGMSFTSISTAPSMYPVTNSSRGSEDSNRARLDVSTDAFPSPSPQNSSVIRSSPVVKAGAGVAIRSPQQARPSPTVASPYGW